MKAGREFFNLYNHDLIRLAVATPAVRVADPAFNGEQTLALIRRAADRKAVLVLFPELGLSAYTCDDLFQQRVVLDGCVAALERILESTRHLPIVSVIGLPLEVGHLLFNCAAVISRGRILGIVPKTYLPGYREFYEVRQFTSGAAAPQDHIDVAGQRGISFGSSILFRCEELRDFVFHVEICEDLWVPIPPSSYAALAGATVLLNLSASNITVGKADFRHTLVASQSARCLAAYLYSASGPGESTTDLAWDGQALIAENGNLLAESRRFTDEPQLICTEIDLERLAQERMRQNSFAENIRLEHDRVRQFRSVEFAADPPCVGRLLPERVYERFPYVPSDPARRDERCSEVYEIQVQGLATRLRATGIKRVVIGVSGGLDSTHALLVCAQAMDRLRYPRSNILAYTMPGFATSKRTLEQARRLMDAIGCEAHEMDIRPSALQMLKDIEHPYAEGRPVYDITFENVQAGERTSHLFRLANLHERAGRRHRRSERVGAGMVHLRRRRSHVALRGERERAQDAHPAHHSMGRVDQPPRRRGLGGAAGHPGNADQSRAGSGERGSGCDAVPGYRGDAGPLRTARLLPLLHIALWLSALEERIPRVCGVA